MRKRVSLFNVVRFTVCVAAISLITVGCRWNDDFRQRAQPQYEPLNAEPTFNEDSDDYVGDRVAKEARVDEHGQRVYMPEVDEREPIPEVEVVAQ